MKADTIFILAMLMLTVDTANAAPPTQTISASEPQNAAAQPKLREQPGEAAPAGLLTELLTANRGWLKSHAQALSYSFSMEHKDRSDRWEAAVEFTAPDRVTIRNTRQQIFTGSVDNHYDPSNSAYPWIFDMEFSVLGGQGWLLKELKESQGGQKAVTASVSDVKLLADH